MKFVTHVEAVDVDIVLLFQSEMYVIKGNDCYFTDCNKNFETGVQVDIYVNLVWW